MAASFLHGVETIEIDDGAKPIKAVKSAVIGLVGTALSPLGDTPKLISSAKDISKYGAASGGTIVPALEAIYAQGGAQVFVVNAAEVEDVEGTIVSKVSHEIVIKSGYDTITVKDSLGATVTPGIKGNILTFTTPSLGEEYTVTCTNSAADSYTQKVLISEGIIGTLDVPISLEGEFNGVFNACDLGADKDCIVDTLTITLEDNSRLSIGDTVLVGDGLATESFELLTIGADKTATATKITAIDSVSLKLVEGKDFDLDTKTAELSAINGGRIVVGADTSVRYLAAKTYTGGTPVENAAAKVAAENEAVKNGFDKLTGLYNAYGFLPKILIAPGFSEIDEVAAKMVSIADNIRAVAIIDVETDADAGLVRSNAAPTSSDRVMLVHPKLMVNDKVEDAQCYSQFLAGVMAAKDVEKGYWWSPSNTEIKGITGVSRELTAMINDPYCDVNILNESAVTTVFNSFGTGLRAWGNRSAAYPTTTGADSFISVRRTADVIHESIEYSMLQFIDRPINSALIDAITESVNSFIRTLIARGAVLDGKCWFDPEKNESTQVADGHLVFSYDFMPPTPAERITFESKINTEYLKALGA